MQVFRRLISGVTRFDELYGIINDALDSLRSQFSGVQFPDNPTTGQKCFRVDMSPPREFTFDGRGWVDPASGSPALSGVIREVENARGAAATVQARLDVALNDDGTLKGNAPASDWWTQEADPVSRVSGNQFSATGDKRAIYTKRRAVRLKQSRDARSHVLDVAFDGSNTIVSLTDRIVDSGLSGVFFGQEAGNEPLAMGFRQFEFEITSPDGRQVITLADHGLPPIPPPYFPLLQVLGGVPYRTAIQDILADAFTVRLFMPDGRPGATVTSGIVTSGSGLRSGTGMRSGQRVPVRGVKIGCLVPL
jgi:hypothetical protein